MKSFFQYVQLREDDFDEKGTDSPAIEPLEKDEAASLFKIIWSRYKDSVRDFLERLAEDNDDIELKELIKKLDGSGNDLPNINQDQEDLRPEVVPPEADRGAGEGGGEE
jgi:hypothetical protein